MRRGESVAIPPEEEAAMGPSLAISGSSLEEEWEEWDWEVEVEGLFCRGL